MPAPCEAQDHFHLSSTYTTVCKTICKYLHTGSQNQLHLASLGLRSILAVQEGSGSFPSSKSQGIVSCLWPASSTFTQVSPLPPSSGILLPAGSAGWPRGPPRPGSSGVLSGWSFSIQCIAGNDSGRRPTGQCRDGWEGQPAGLHPQGKKTGLLRHWPWPAPGLDSNFQKKRQLRGIFHTDCALKPIHYCGESLHQCARPCK